MKKGIYVTLAAVALTTGMLMGCSSGKDESQAVKQEAEKSEAAVDDALNVVILINGNLGDKAFYDSAANGGKMIREELGDNVKVVEKIGRAHV